LFTPLPGDTGSSASAQSTGGGGPSLPPSELDVSATPLVSTTSVVATLPVVTPFEVSTVPVLDALVVGALAPVEPVLAASSASARPQADDTVSKIADTTWIGADALGMVRMSS